MTLPMDVRIAADDAKLGFVFARRGIVPEACSSWFLPRIVGISRAMEWAATGRVFSRRRRRWRRASCAACTQGRGGRRPARSRRRSRRTRRRYRSRSRGQLMWRMLGADHPMVAHRADSRAMSARGRSADAHEGVTAFLEKRDAAFTDRVSDGLPDVFPDYREPEFR